MQITYADPHSAGRCGSAALYSCGDIEQHPGYLSVGQHFNKPSSSPHQQKLKVSCIGCLDPLTRKHIRLKRYHYFSIISSSSESFRKTLQQIFPSFGDGSTLPQLICRKCQRHVSSYQIGDTIFEVAATIYSSNSRCRPDRPCNICEHDPCVRLTNLQIAPPIASSSPPPPVPEMDLLPDHTPHRARHFFSRTITAPPVTAASHLSLAAQMQLSTSASLRLAQSQNSAAGSGPGQVKLRKHYRELQGIFSQLLVSVPHHSCTTNGSFTTTPRTADWLTLLVFLIGYRIRDVKWIKITSDFGQGSFKIIITPLFSKGGATEMPTISRSKVLDTSVSNSYIAVIAPGCSESIATTALLFNSLNLSALRKAFPAARIIMSNDMKQHNMIHGVGPPSSTFGIVATYHSSNASKSRSVDRTVADLLHDSAAYLRNKSAVDADPTSADISKASLQKRYRAADFNNVLQKAVDFVADNLQYDLLNDNGPATLHMTLGIAATGIRRLLSINKLLLVRYFLSISVVAEDKRGNISLTGNDSLRFIRYAFRLNDFLDESKKVPLLPRHIVLQQHDAENLSARIDRRRSALAVTAKLQNYDPAAISSVLLHTRRRASSQRPAAIAATRRLSEGPRLTRDDDSSDPDWSFTDDTDVGAQQEMFENSLRAATDHLDELTEAKHSDEEEIAAAAAAVHSATTALEIFGDEVSHRRKARFAASHPESIRQRRRQPKDVPHRRGQKNSPQPTPTPSSSSSSSSNSSSSTSSSSPKPRRRQPTRISARISNQKSLQAAAATMNSICEADSKDTAPPFPTDVDVPVSVEDKIDLSDAEQDVIALLALMLYAYDAVVTATHKKQLDPNYKQIIADFATADSNFQLAFFHLSHPDKEPTRDLRSPKVYYITELFPRWLEHHQQSAFFASEQSAEAIHHTHRRFSEIRTTFRSAAVLIPKPRSEQNYEVRRRGLAGDSSAPSRETIRKKRRLTLSPATASSGSSTSPTSEDGDEHKAFGECCHITCSLFTSPFLCSHQYTFFFFSIYSPLKIGQNVSNKKNKM